MDRRHFLETVAGAAAGLGLAACTNTKTEKRASAMGDGDGMATNYPGIGLLGYGCMRWPLKDDGNGGKVIDQDQVNRLVDEAIRSGVNYFDSAPIYLGGNCEEATSIALNRHPRDKWLLATKLSNFNAWDYESSLKMYRHSLEVFRTDHIDYYLLHALSGGKDFEKRFGSTGIMDFLLAEREAGHIRNLGFSFHGDQSGFDEMMALHDRYHWDFVQIQMNYLDWEYPGPKNTKASYLYAELVARNIPVVIMEPIRGGALASLPKHFALRLKEKEPDRSVASWAFRYLGGFPAILTVLSGMSEMAHLKDNLDTFCNLKTLDDSEVEMLYEMAAEMDSHPLIRCTGCRYCMPCPYGIDIPGIFAFYNNSVNEGSYVTSQEQKNYARAKKRYLLAYDKAVQSSAQADHCISCGKCVKACPQHISIPRELRKIDVYIEDLKQDRL